MKISVIVPCYNQGNYLSDAITSVLKQTYTQWECIIVNDGSTDNTEEIAQQWCRKDNRIKYIKQKNGGVSAARNAAIRASAGDYILPLDADDKISKDYVEQALNVLEKDPEVTLVYAEADYFGTKTGHWALTEYDYKSLLTRNLIYCSAIYRKADWQTVGGYDEEAKDIEDWEFWLRLLYGEKKVHRIRTVGFYYRHHENSRNLAIVLNDEKRMAIEGYIYIKHKKIYDEYLGSVISYLRTIFKLKAELTNIKKSLPYRFSTKVVMLITPIRNFVKPSYKERANTNV